MSSKKKGKKPNPRIYLIPSGTEEDTLLRKARREETKAARKAKRARRTIPALEKI